VAEVDGTCLRDTAEGIVVGRPSGAKQRDDIGLSYTLLRPHACHSMNPLSFDLEAGRS